MVNQLPRSAVKMSIEKELLKLTGIKGQKKKETEQSFLKRILLAIDKTEDDKFFTLSDETQKWVDNAIDAVEEKEEIPSFENEDDDEDDDEDEDEEEKKPKRRKSSKKKSKKDEDDEDEDEDDGTFHSCGFLQYEYKIYKIPISKYKKLEKTYIHMRICTGRYTDKAFLLFIKKERGTLALDITNALINAW